MEIGIVIPTLGTRLEYLDQCLHSIRNAGDSFIAVVAPHESCIAQLIDQSLFNLIVPDPNKGLAAAINSGINALPDSISFVNWLGDDDMLTEQSLNIASESLRANQDAVLVYGGCEYIDQAGNTLWKNRSGRFASSLIHFGPQLIPQPGALFRRKAFIEIGGLDESYKWAFDLDLLFKLKNLGRLHFVDQTLAKFRWHDGSLSVGSRKGSVNEASVIRRKSLPRPLQNLSPIWEVPIRFLILISGRYVSKKAKNGKF
jgi:glycosyltransferase involved in cell wall biosynthesis